MSASPELPSGLAARHVIITGISRGLGAALFDLLDREGTRLLGIGRTFTGRQRQAARNRPDRVTLYRVDLRDTDRLPTHADLTAFLAGCGEDDEVVVVHNAATVGAIGLVGQLDTTALRDTVTVNLIAPMALTNTVLAATPAAVRRLRVLYISSGAAHRPYPGWAGYCATKAGAEMFLRCVGEAAARPCTVEIVDPGAMETAMQQTIRARGHGLPGHERLVQRHELGQITHAHTVAQQIAAEHFAAEPDLVA